MHFLLDLYQYILRLSSHAKARYYLFVLSFAESSFFPIPPDVMLAPMCLTNKTKIWQFAFITTLGSVLGGVFGYVIGFYGFDFIEPVINNMGYSESYLLAVRWFNDWGFWAVLIAGFSPIPYKVFTIAGGVLQMPFAPFLLASLVGRGARFYLIAFLVRIFGDQADSLIKRYMDKIGWALVILIVLILVFFAMV